MDSAFFKFIERTLEIKEENQVELTYISGRLEYYFTRYFGEAHGFLSINSRIKSSRSFKEKILRNNLYLKHETPEELFYSLPDLIGIRIECRFNKDEEAIFKLIKKEFSDTEDGMYYSIPGNKAIYLKLGEDQPKTQKNKFPIYKIDGYYERGEKTFSFELQIKSLVNVFWGEIDHRILYKNYTYMLTEDFFRDIMYSIKDNLTMIDRQLMILYNQVNAMDMVSRAFNQDQIYSIFSKILHDEYVGKVYRELGFVIDFDFPSDIIIRYLHAKSKDQMNVTQDHILKDFIADLIGKLDQNDTSHLSFHSLMELEEEVEFDSPFSKNLGKKITSVINHDFWWNLFFIILEDIEGTKIHEEIQSFLDFLEDQLKEKIERDLSQARFREEEEEIVVSEILAMIGDHLSREWGLHYVLNYVFKQETPVPHHDLRKIKNYRDYLATRESLREAFDKEEEE
ncbi:MAG: hypothetical protein Q4E37_02415 [Tissierellia bacterium]|nr:hypothetical protein [Tissierellia bacterium]